MASGTPGMNSQQSMMLDMMQQRFMGGMGGGTMPGGMGGGMMGQPGGMAPGGLPGMGGGMPNLIPGMGAGMPPMAMPVPGGMNMGAGGMPAVLGATTLSKGGGAPPPNLGMNGGMPPLQMPNGLPGMTPLLPPPMGGGATLPSLAAPVPKAGGGGGGQTVADNEVKVQDERGRPTQNYTQYASFDDCPFPPGIQNAIKEAGFPSPSQIQQYCWPLSMAGKDVIGVAATGSGKTLGFLLPAFTTILEKQLSQGDPHLLVMAPTRELAVQIQEESDKFAKKAGLVTLCCYGGAPKGPQADQIKRGVHGIIGTPGRLNDFVEGRQLNMGRICKLVLDEADRMLDMGFEPQIRKVLAEVPRSRQTMMFTATWPPSVRRLANEFMSGPWTVTIGNRDELKGNQDITQIIQTCEGRDKDRYLMQFLKQAGVSDRGNVDAKGLVFASTKKMCDNLCQKIERNGIPCHAVHGDKKQNERENALKALKEGRSKLLVCTDVAARGLDIKGVTLVIQYDPAGQIEDYVHRIGRTGRAGQKGVAITLICERDTHALKGILGVMSRTNQAMVPEIEEMSKNAPPPPPSGRAARGGPPPVQIDPNFKKDLNSSGGKPLETPPATTPRPSFADEPLPERRGGGGGGKGPGKGRGDDRGDRGDRGGGGGGGRGRSPPRRSRSRRRPRSPSRRRRDRSRSRRRRSPSRRRRARSESSGSGKGGGGGGRDRKSPSVQRQREASGGGSGSDDDGGRRGRKDKDKKKKKDKKRKRSSSSSGSRS
eukprot:TRINITY_DN169_c1_g1_i1.p1 TRINITY_DN169_c1_g1~~TRINITY_DN169_c1_g1_i1.p1  ORF type:complete len:764 (-),score=188.09 TRINITY_DN169_c1_g1_i1:152-2443(-)